MFFRLNREGYHHWSYQLTNCTLLSVDIKPYGDEFKGYISTLYMNGIYQCFVKINEGTLADIQPKIEAMVKDYLKTLENSVNYLFDNNNEIENCITRTIIA